MVECTMLRNGALGLVQVDPRDVHPDLDLILHAIKAIAEGLAIKEPSITMKSNSK